MPSFGGYTSEVKLTIAQVETFVAKWRKLRLNDDDLQALEKLIIDNPESGAVMVGTGGLRKIRFAPPSWNRGKSGATRVCYAFFSRIDTVYLIDIFAKSEKPNLSDADKALAKKWMKMMRERHAN